MSGVFRLCDYLSIFFIFSHAFLAFLLGGCYNTLFIFLIPVAGGYGLFGENNPYRLPDSAPSGDPLRLEYDGKAYAWDTDVINILLLGTDEMEEDENVFHQADTILLLTLHKKTGKIDLLPIPRDTVTPVMRFDMEGNYAYTLPGFISTGHAYGQDDRLKSGRLSEATVSHFLYDIPIHRFFSFSIGPYPAPRITLAVYR